ncbi:hypothetical protein HYALB_00003198 [Hymenoscyphus albidus]|uniref:Uncharacterized protein n=1 Tax=Hymenoscyphus albidus TaxID=595503 RepID=A0A9N9M0S7_9HELO|nr:hypothetical protein HYALB_00003198 [Hymenoscyphus albidus]
MGLPLFSPYSEDIEQRLNSTLYPLQQLLRATTTIQHYLTYKSKIVSVTLDFIIQKQHALQTEHLPPSAPHTSEFLSFAEESVALQEQIRKEEWEAHFLRSPQKFEVSIVASIETSNERVPPALFSSTTETNTNTTTNDPLPPTQPQIHTAYCRVLNSIVHPNSFRQPNGLGRNSRSFTEHRFRTNVLDYSCVSDSRISADTTRRYRRTWCHVLCGWSGLNVRMIRFVPLDLVSRKLATLFVDWNEEANDFEEFFNGGENGVALHEPFASALSQGILALVPSSLDESGSPEGYKFLLADESYAEKESGKGHWESYNGVEFVPSPLNTRPRPKLPSLRFVYFRLLLTYITHLHLGKPTKWFKNLLNSEPELFRPLNPPFRGEMLRFFLNFAGVDWDTKQGLRGLMDDGGTIKENIERKDGEEELDWREVDKMARAIKVDCVSFGSEIERNRIEEERRVNEAGVDGLFDEDGENGNDTIDLGNGSIGIGNVAGFLIRTDPDDADDERPIRDNALWEDALWEVD